MKILYIDAFSGVSGDKFVAALLSLGDYKDMLLKSLSTLRIKDEFEIKIYEKKLSGIKCLKFDVIDKHHAHFHNHSEDHHRKEADKHPDKEHFHHHNGEADDDHHKQHSHEHHHRGLSEIKDIITTSGLSDRAKKSALDIFQIIGEAESNVHNVALDEVHFHEVGAVDSIVDIVSIAVLIDIINPDKIISSNIPLGSGFVNTMHGRLPVPAPATSLILTGVPVYQGDVKTELTTPTGAAAVKFFADDYSEMNNLKIEKIGYGAGTKEFEIPNFLRIFYGSKSGSDTDAVTILESNIDDSSPEELGYLFNKLFENNALDVYITPVYMKKNRPGALLSVICKNSDTLKLEELIFNNSTTFGIRKNLCSRMILQREIKEINVLGEAVKVKLGYYKGKMVQTSLEYESVKNASDKLGMSYNKFVKNATFEMIKAFKIE